MSSISNVATDKEGYLKNLADWTLPVAQEIAATEAIQLSDKHVEVITLLRDVYAEFDHTPVTRVFVKLMRERLGAEKGSSMYLLSLFPDTPMRKACKIAGLPKPTNCL